MGYRLQGRTAVVTGAGRGIGRAIALALAAEGAAVVVNDLGTSPAGAGSSSAPADDVATEIRRQGGQAIANYDTVATASGGEKIIAAALDHFGSIDILVNNAGFLRLRMIHNMSPEEWDEVVKVHLYGTFYCTRPAVTLMRKQRWGRIVNMTSGAGLTGALGTSNYGAAKAGIVGFTRCCAMELRGYGITVNAIAPFAVTRLEEQTHEALVKSGIIKFPAGGAPPENVAIFTAYLATEDAAAINGCTFSVMGGRIDLNTDPVPVKSIFCKGRWTLEELIDCMPHSLAENLPKPAAPTD